MAQNVTRVAPQHWWALVVRGLVAILFGLAAFLVPAITLRALVLLFGAYALVDGIFAVVAAIRKHEEHGRWWALLLEGIAGIVVGVLTFVWPAVTTFVLLYLIAAWAIVTGAFELAAAIWLRRIITNEFWLALSGVVSLVFGVLLIVWPSAGALTIVWLIGAYAILFGALLLILGLRLRRLA